MSETIVSRTPERITLIDNIFIDLSKVGQYLNDGEYRPTDAYQELIDIYLSYAPQIDETAQTFLQELTFGYARDVGIDMDEALEIWRNSQNSVRKEF